MITFDNLGNNGRLGNQMFQYSAIKYLSIKNNFLLKLPNGDYSLLKHFDLKEELLDLHDLKKIKYQYNEKKYSFDQSFFEIKDDTNINGYFQSELYFKDIEELIKDKFKFNIEIYEKNKNYLNNLKTTLNKDIVSVHFRRTDYLDKLEYHPICSPEYYKKSMELFDKNNNVFLIFSDDIDWCKKIFSNKNVYFSDNSDEINDLCKMSLCDHNIIANSTFSWWAAWLNDNKNKKIVAPKKWFGHKSDNHTENLYCTGWIIL